MNTLDQITKVQHEIALLSDRITTTQVTVGDGLSLLTRQLREKQEMLSSLEALLSRRKLEIESITPGMVEPDIASLPEKL